jgi:hypothetical protein
MRKQYIETTFGELSIGSRFWSYYCDRGDVEIEKIKTDISKCIYVDTTPGVFWLYEAEFPVWIEKEVYGWYEYLIWICITIMAMTILALTFWIVNHFNTGV